MVKLKRLEVVRTVELSPIRMGSDGDELCLRIEILRSKHGTRAKFAARVWRVEFYRIQSSFPQRGGQPAHAPSDERVMTIEDGLSEAVEGSSEKDVLNRIIRKIEERFLT